MIPEDEQLCQHSYRDLYGGDGVSKHDPLKSIVTFYCIKCLDIRTKTYSRANYYLDPEFIQKFHDDNDTPAGV